jgi:hypothetical protein
MRAVAHNPSFAKKVGIPQSVGKDYAEADKGRKFGSGGTMKESKAMMKKEVSFMKKKGAPASMIKHEEAEMSDKAGRAMKRRTADTMGRAMVGYKEGGSVYRKVADCIASKGKTKGKMVKMSMGGKC